MEAGIVMDQHTHASSRTNCLVLALRMLRDQYDERGALVQLDGRNLFQVWQLHISMYS
jgi:hypothetical protein